MRRLALFLVLAAAIAPACILGKPVANTSSVGDVCLVGSWTLMAERNASGYTYEGVPVAVSGLQGATMIISTAGDESVNYAESGPLTGSLADGRQLVIVIRGSFHLSIHAQNGSFAESGTRTNLPTTAAVGGVPVTDYHSYYEPSRGSYTCTSSTLVMTTTNGVQATTWTKG